MPVPKEILLRPQKTKTLCFKGFQCLQGKVN